MIRWAVASCAATLTLAACAGSGAGSAPTSREVTGKLLGAGVCTSAEAGAPFLRGGWDCQERKVGFPTWVWAYPTAQAARAAEAKFVRRFCDGVGPLRPHTATVVRGSTWFVVALSEPDVIRVLGGRTVRKACPARNG